MRVLKAAKDVQRQRTLMVGLSSFIAFGILTTATLWWLCRPGTPIEGALGITLPPGSRAIHAESVQTTPEAPYAAVYISATWSLDDAVAHFSERAADRDPSSRRFRMKDGTFVIVAPAEDVPATRVMPIRPVSEGVPLGTGSWIVIMRGTPPAATWTAAVPPDLGES